MIFEEIPYMVGFVVFTFIFGYMIRRALPSPFHKITEIVMILGVIIHEMCHILVCILTNAKIESVSLVERFKIDRRESGDRIKYKYGGNVQIDEEKRLTFFQAFLIAFAPVYIGFWIFFFLLDIFLHGNLDMLEAFFVVFVMCSIILGVPPSFQDLKMIGVAIKRDSVYSLYQIILVVVSVLILWGGMYFFEWHFFHEIIFYFLVGLTYYILRYSLKGIRSLHQHFTTRNRTLPKHISPRNPYRKRVRPEKRKKDRIERCQW